MKKLWETAKGNLTFVFVCLLTFAVIAFLAFNYALDRRHGSFSVFGCGSAVGRW